MRQAGLAGSEVGQDLLDHPLAAAVGVDRIAAHVLAELLDAGLAVHGGRRGEDQVAHAGPLHGLEQRDAAAHVVVVIPQRLHGGLADGLEAGEVHDRLDALGGEEGIECRGVAHIGLDEPRLSAGDAADATQGFGAAVAEVVQHQRRIAGFDERDAGMHADIAAAAGDQDDGLHARLLAQDRPRLCGDCVALSATAGKWRCGACGESRWIPARRCAPSGMTSVKRRAVRGGVNKGRARRAG